MHATRDAAPAQAFMDDLHFATNTIGRMARQMKLVTSWEEWAGAKVKPSKSALALKLGGRKKDKRDWDLVTTGCDHNPFTKTVAAGFPRLGRGIPYRYLGAQTTTDGLQVEQKKYIKKKITSKIAKLFHSNMSWSFRIAILKANIVPAVAYLLPLTTYSPREIEDLTKLINSAARGRIKGLRGAPRAFLNAQQGMGLGVPDMGVEYASALLGMITKMESSKLPVLQNYAHHKRKADWILRGQAELHASCGHSCTVTTPALTLPPTARKESREGKQYNACREQRPKAMRNRATQILWWSTQQAHCAVRRDDTYLPRQSCTILDALTTSESWMPGESQYIRASQAARAIEGWWKQGVTITSHILATNGAPLPRAAFGPHPPSLLIYRKVCAALEQNKGENTPTLPAQKDPGTILPHLHAGISPLSLTPCKLTDVPKKITCGKGIYQARRIIGQKEKKGTRWYKVEWESRRKDKPTTWEPSENILHPHLIEEWGPRSEGKTNSNAKGTQPKKGKAKPPRTKDTEYPAKNILAEEYKEERSKKGRPKRRLYYLVRWMNGEKTWTTAASCTKPLVREWTDIQPTKILPPFPYSPDVLLGGRKIIKIVSDSKPQAHSHALDYVPGAKGAGKGHVKLPCGTTLTNRTYKRLVGRHEKTNPQAERANIATDFKSLLASYTAADSRNHWSLPEDLATLFHRNLAITTQIGSTPLNAYEVWEGFESDKDIDGRFGARTAQQGTTTMPTGAYHILPHKLGNEETKKWIQRALVGAHQKVPFRCLITAAAYEGEIPEGARAWRSLLQEEEDEENVEIIGTTPAGGMSLVTDEELRTNRRGQPHKDRGLTWILIQNKAARHQWKIPEKFEAELLMWLQQHCKGEEEATEESFHIALGTNNIRENTLALGTDTACIFTDGSQKDGAASWAVWTGDSKGTNNPHGRVKGKQTSSRGELTALHQAIKLRTPSRNKDISTDSETSQKLIGKWTNPYTRGNMRNVENADVLAQTLQAIQEHNSGHIIIRKVKAHAGIYGNERVDKLADTARELASHESEPPTTLQYTEKTQHEPVTREGTAYIKACGYAALEEKALAHWMYRTPGQDWDRKTSTAFMRHKSFQPSERLQIWKLRTSLFATQAWLHKVGIADTDMCQRCGANRETITHFQAICPHWEAWRRTRHNALLEIIAEGIRTATAEERRHNTTILRVDMSFPAEILDTTAYEKGNTRALRPDLVLRRNVGEYREKLAVADVKVPSETSTNTTTELGATHYQWIIDELVAQGEWEQSDVTLDILPITSTGMIPSTLISTLEKMGLNHNAAKRLCMKLHLRAAHLQADQIKSRWATDSAQ
jgi:ribonuclease HI